MVPEFSLCSIDDGNFKAGLYRNAGVDGCVVYATDEEDVFRLVLEFWLDQWGTFSWDYLKPKALLLPGQLL